MTLLLAMIAAPVSPAPRDCALTVQFGSYAMGIDRPAAEKIERFLRGRRDVAGLSRHPWGREGEYTLCVRLKAGAQPARLAQELKTMIPAKPRGPIRIELSTAR